MKQWWSEVVTQRGPAFFREVLGTMPEEFDSWAADLVDDTVAHGAPEGLTPMRDLHAQGAGRRRSGPLARIAVPALLLRLSRWAWFFVL